MGVGLVAKVKADVLVNNQVLCISFYILIFHCVSMHNTNDLFWKVCACVFELLFGQACYYSTQCAQFTTAFLAVVKIK